MRRLGWILLGYIASQLSNAIVGSVVFGERVSIGGLGQALLVAFVPTRNASAVAFPLAVLIAELVPIRSIIYYLAFSLVPTAFLYARLGRYTVSVAQFGREFVALAAIGLVSATVYWWIAGRHAGPAGKPSFVSAAQRLGKILIGYLACVAAATVAVTAVVGTTGSASSFPVLGIPPQLSIFVFLSGAPAFVVCVLIAESSSVRSLLYYACFGAVPGATFFITPLAGGGPPSLQPLASAGAFGMLVALFVVPGIIGACVYWWVAGRYAGRKAAAPAA